MNRVIIFIAAVMLVLTSCAADEPEKIVQVEEPEVPIETEAPEETELEIGEIIVATDWSKLGEYTPMQQIGSRWYEEYTDHLILRDDYGTLIPYAGERLMDDWPANSGCLYGLMTTDGVAVTDPVYSGAYRLSYYDAGRWQVHPLLILVKGGERKANGSFSRYAVAAADGSWCTEFEYMAYRTDSEGLVLFKEDSLEIMLPDGELQYVWKADEMGISKEEFDNMLFDAESGEGWGGDRRGDYIALRLDVEQNINTIYCFNLITGEIRTMSLEEWRATPEEVSEEYSKPVPVVNGAERIRDSLLGDDAPGIWVLRESHGGVTRTYYLDDGTPLPQFTFYGDKWYEQISVVGGLIEVLELNTASYYDIETLECVFRTDLNYGWD